MAAYSEVIFDLLWILYLFIKQKFQSHPKSKINVNETLNLKLQLNDLVVWSLEPMYGSGVNVTACGAMIKFIKTPLSTKSNLDGKKSLGF